MDAVIETFGITKVFGKLIAVDHINLEIKKEVFGLLGPNGAGKTTLTPNANNGPLAYRGNRYRRWS